jgi:hypothetical protein
LKDVRYRELEEEKEGKEGRSTERSLNSNCYERKRVFARARLKPSKEATALKPISCLRTLTIDVK